MKHVITFLLLGTTTMLWGQKALHSNRIPAKVAERYDDDIPGNVLFYEGFENGAQGSLPGGWKSFSLAGQGFVCGTAGDAPGQTNENGYWKVPFHGIFAMSNDDVCNCNKSQDRLQSPALNLTGFSDVYVQFSSYNDGSSGQEARLEIRSAGQAWTNLLSIKRGADWRTHRAAIPKAYLESGFQMRFYYDDMGNYASGLAIDDVYIYTGGTDRFSLDAFYSIEASDPGSGQLYYSIPTSQARKAEFRFGALINNDADQLKNARLAVQVSGPLSYNDTSANFLLNGRASETIGFGTRKRFSPYLPGTYNLEATVLTDSTDQEVMDNHFTQSFGVMDSIYSRTNSTAPDKLGIWLSAAGDRFGTYYEMFEADTVRAVYVRIHPASVPGARFRVKIFNADTLTSSSYSSPPVTITADQLGTTLRIPVNRKVAKGKQLFCVERESIDDLHLIISANPQIPVSEDNVLFKKFGQNWKPYTYFPMISLVVKGTDSICRAHVQYEVEDESCPGSNDGHISTQVFDANIPFTYNWSNGAGNVSEISNLTPGNYDLFVTDAENCIYEYNFEVRASDTIKFNAGLTPDSCGTSSGSIGLNLTGGTAPFSIKRNGSACTSISPGLDQGTYIMAVEDAHGCLADTSISLPGTETLGIAFNITEADCLDSNGSIGTTVFGTPPFQYQWSTGDTASQLLQLFAGEYLLTVSDSLGCETEGRAFVININAPSSTIAAVSHVDCFSDETGSISINTGGGQPPYSFAWSNGAVTEDISGLAGGVYTLTLTDTAGCMSFMQVGVNDNNLPLIIDANDRGNYCMGDNAGVIQLLINGGTNPYTIDWSSGDTGPFLSSLAAGSYTYIVTDGAGCSSTDTIDITSGNFFVVSISEVIWDSIDNFLDEGHIYTSLLGGTPPYTFIWNDSISSQHLINVPPGQYNLVASDQLGCLSTLSYLLENGPASIEEKHEPEIRIYPVPSRAGSSIHIACSSDIKGIKFYNIGGHQLEIPMQILRTDRIMLETGTLGPGIYLVEIWTGIAYSTQRICILR